MLILFRYGKLRGIGVTNPPIMACFREHMQQNYTYLFRRKLFQWTHRTALSKCSFAIFMLITSLHILCVNGCFKCLLSSYSFRIDNSVLREYAPLTILLSSLMEVSFCCHLDDNKITTKKFALICSPERNHSKTNFPTNLNQGEELSVLRI